MNIKKINFRILSALVICIILLIVGAFVYTNLENSQWNTLQPTPETKNKISKSLEAFFKVPRVHATNIDHKSKIAYNAPIVVSFTQFMDQKSAEEAFRVYPSVDGSFSWPDKKTLVFTPFDNFEINTEYQVLISIQAENIEGENIVEPYTHVFSTVEAPKIILVTPEGESDVQNKITVMFDRPMFALSTLDATDNFDYPIEIEPKPEGRFRLLSTSAFQFEPETYGNQRFPYATNFTVTIPEGFSTIEGGKIEQGKVFTFSTPQIELQGKTEELIHDSPYTLYFNQPMDIEKFRRNFQIQQDGKNVNFTVKHFEKKETINGKEEIHIDETRLEVFPQSETWGYDNTYIFTLEEGLEGKEGNIAFEKSFEQKLTVRPLIDGITPSFEQEVGRNVQPEIWFHEEVDIESLERHMSFVPAQKFSLEYGKKCQQYARNTTFSGRRSPCEKEVEDKKKVKVYFEEKLDFETQYTMTVDKSLKNTAGKSPMGKTYTKNFTTASPTEILGFSHNGSYKELCVYSNNELSTKDLAEVIDFPENFKQKVSGYTQKLNLGNSLYNTCNDPEYLGKYSLYISTLLEPDTDYRLNISTRMKDVYGEEILYNFPINILTEPFNEEDASGAFMHNDDFLVVPHHMKQGVMFQSYNVEEFESTVCKVSPQVYMDQKQQVDQREDFHFHNVWETFEPNNVNCEKLFQNTNVLEKKYWESTFTEISLQENSTNNESEEKVEEGLYIVQIRSPFLKHKRYEWINEERELKDVTDQVISLAVLVTKTGIFAKDVNGKQMMWAVDLETGKPRIDLQIQTYDEFGEGVLQNFVGKGDGTYWQETENDWKYLFANNSETFSMVSQDFQVYSDPQNSDERNYENFFTTPQYIYTERPIYKPGQTVFVNGFIREEQDVLYSVPEQKTVRLTLRDPQYTEIIVQNGILTTDTGTFSADIFLEESIPSGIYRLDGCIIEKSGEEELCENTMTTTFQVEEYKKPEYELNVVVPEKNVQDSETASVTFNAEYYFGAPFTGNVEWSVYAKPWEFNRYTEGGYSFQDREDYWRCRWICILPYWKVQDYFVKNGTTLLSRIGEEQITIQTDIREHNSYSEDSLESLEYTVEATIADESVQTVFAQEKFIAHKGAYYPGVKVEKSFVQAGDTVNVDVITVDPEGKPFASKKVYVKLFQFVESSENDENNTYNFEEKLISTKEVITSTDGKTTTFFNINENSGGQYKVVVQGFRDEESHLRASTQFFASSISQITWYENDENTLSIYSDQKQYFEDDTATLRIKSPYNSAKALVTTERGGIYDYKIQNFTQNIEEVEFPITQRYVPNVYASVIVFQPGANPEFRIGTTNILVNTQNNNLNIDLRPNKSTYKPGETVSLEIRTTNSSGQGVPADISLAVVDKAIFALKERSQKDILDFFYALRNFETKNLITLAKALSKTQLEFYTDLQSEEDIIEESQNTDAQQKSFGFADESLSIPATVRTGGGGAIEETASLRKNFQDTAFFIPQLTTSSEGLATLEIPLADNITTWNLEAIGITSNTLVGSANTEIVTQKDIFIRPQFPRFVRRGDEVNWSVIVENLLDEDQTITLEIEAKNIEFSNSSVSETLEKKGSKTIDFSSVVSKLAPLHNEKITVKLVSENSSDAIEVRIPIEHAATPETIATSSFTESTSFREILRFPTVLDPTLGSIEVSFGAVLTDFLPESIAYIASSEYNVNEVYATRLQSVNQAKFLYDQALLTQDRYNVLFKNAQQETVSAESFARLQLEKLYKNQNADGGWGYWERGSRSHAYISAYIVHTLYNAKNIGLVVDENALERGVLYVQNTLKNRLDLNEKTSAIETSYQANNRAYMLYVLADMGIVLQEDIQELISHEDKLSIFAKGYMLMIFEKTSDEENIQKYINFFENNAKISQRGVHFEGINYSYRHFASSAKTTAVVLQALLSVDKNHPFVPKIVNHLLSTKEAKHWENAHNTGVIIESFLTYIVELSLQDSRFTGKVLLNDTLFGEVNIGQDTQLTRAIIQKKLSDLNVDIKDNIFEFTKIGTGQMYYDIVLEYFMPIELIQVRNEGIAIDRAYFDVLDTALETPRESYEKGETLRGRVSVVVPEERNFVVVENFIPAGFELVNFNLNTANATLQRTLETSRQSEKIYNQFEEPAEDMAVSSFSAKKISPPCYECTLKTWNTVEYKNNKLLLTAENLQPGVYHFDFFVQVTSSGVFHHPPAHVFELYRPEVFGRTRGEVIEIE